MYFVKYGNYYLHDPRVDNCILFDLSLDCEENSCGFCDFTIYSNHPMYDNLRERDANNPIEVWDDDTLLFTGFIYELGKEFYLDGHVKCRGELDYLNESIIRPYATVDRSYGSKAPSTPDEYFIWLINKHNSNVAYNKQFEIGVVQVSSLVPNTYFEIENNNYPTTLEEIKTKLLDTIGGYLNVRTEKGIRYIDYLSERTNTNTQILDFGTNLTDYTQTDDSLEMASCTIPLGAKMSETEYPYNNGYFRSYDTRPHSNKEYFTYSNGSYSKCSDLTSFEAGVIYYEYNKNNDESDLPLTIDELPNGTYGSDGYKKSDDIVYCETVLNKYGWICFTCKNTDIKTREELVQFGVISLKERVSPKRTIEIKAVDMHLVNPSIKPIKIGEYVRVRSKPHKLDSYFLCVNISLDLNNPENSTYVLGTTFDTMTGQQNKRINQLNATINKQYEEARAILDSSRKIASDAESVASAARNSSQSTTARVVACETSVATANLNANNAIASAQNAIVQAEAAQSAAGQASTIVNQIQTEIDSVKGDAESLRDAIEDQIETKVITMTATVVDETELATVESTLRTEITESAAGIRTEVGQTYVRQTDFTNAEADLQSSIQQNSTSIDSIVSDVTTVHIDITSAQNAANNATNLANAAQSSADSAGSTATNAQNAAANAQQAADEAQASVNALQSTTATRLSEIEQSASALTTRVTAAETSVNNLQANVTSQFSEVEQTANGISARVGTVETDLSDLVIGGRNLYLETRNFEGNRWNNLEYWQILGSTITLEDVKSTNLYQNANGYIRYADSKYNYAGVANTSTQNAMAIFNVQPGETYTVGLQMLTRFRIGFMAQLVTGVAVSNLWVESNDTNGATVIDEYKEHTITVPTGCYYMLVGYWSGTAGEWTTTWNSLTVNKNVVTGPGSSDFDYKEYVRNESWMGLSQSVDVIEGEQYTFSFYAKGDANTLIAVYTDQNSTATTPDHITIGAVSTDAYTRYSATFTANITGTINPRVENTVDSLLQVCALKFEHGSRATDWTPAPEDIENAVVDAKKSATDYLGFSDDGLTIGDLTSNELGKNVNISGAGIKIKDGDTILAEFTSTEIDFDKTVVFKADGIMLDNGDAYAHIGRNNILWTHDTGKWMIDSINLTANITRQLSGAVFAWCYFENGAAQDTNWRYFFVPKAHITNHPGAGIYMTDPYLGMNKYIYVSNSIVTGVASNSSSGTTNGLVWDNSKYVLRYVIGV